LNDPVSTKEIDRNNAIYVKQNNRNPYIDHPEYVECIWGTANCVGTGIAAIAEAHGFKLVPNPAKALVNVACNDCQISVLDITGKTIVKGMKKNK
ncbi:MAG: ribonuclease, partial [Sphingobacteriales bacterium]